MVNIHVSSYTQIRTFTRCVNLVIQVLNSYVTIKSVVVLNLEVEVSFPTTRYGISEEVPPLMTDLRPDLYISDIDLLQFEELLNKITTSYSFNSLATYLFISANWMSIENEMYSRHISRIVFMNCSVSGESKNIFNEIEPVSADELECRKKVEKSIISRNVKRKTVGMNLNVCLAAIWFPQVICINCTEKRGIIIEIVDMFSSFMGQSPSYIVSNNTQNFNRDKLFLEECDICLNGLLPENSLVDFILPLRNDFDNWYVPRSPAIPTWKYMVFALPTNIWLIWITVLIALTFLKWMLMKKIVDLDSKQRPLEVLEIASKYFLEQQARTNVTSCSNMFFFYGMALSIFILNVIYKSRFTCLLLGRNFYSQDIQTVQDAAAKGLFVTYSDHLRHDLEILYPDLREYFTSHFVYSDEQGWADMVAFGKNTIALKTSLSAKYLKDKYLDKNGRSLINVLEKPALQSLSGFIFLKGHPILSKMPRFINVLRDHGFLSFIMSKYDLKDSEYGVDVAHRKLGLKQMKGPFLVWFVGNSIGCIIIVLELLINMHSRIL